jgi:hypothetical protein
MKIKLLIAFTFSLVVTSNVHAQYTKQTGVDSYSSYDTLKFAMPGAHNYTTFLWGLVDVWSVTQTQGSSSEPVPWTSSFATLTSMDSAWVDNVDFGAVNIPMGKMLMLKEQGEAGYTDEIWKKNLDDSLYRRKRNGEFPDDATYTIIDLD